MSISTSLLYTYSTMPPYYTISKTAGRASTGTYCTGLQLRIGLHIQLASLPISRGGHANQAEGGGEGEGPYHHCLPHAGQQRLLR
jgi:hypothetical protein